MAVRTRGLTGPGRAAGATLAAAIALGAGGAAVAADRSADAAWRDGAEAAARADGARLEQALEETALALAALAEGAGGESVAAFRQAAPALTAGTLARAVALTRLDAAGRAITTTVSPAGTPPLVRDEAIDADELLAAALADASPATGLTADGAVLGVAPITTAPADAPVAERRAASTGFVVALLDLDGYVDRLFQGADVVLRADDETVVARGDADGTLLQSTVQVGDSTWDLAADAPTRDRGWVPWAILALGAALAAAAGSALHAALRARDEAAARADDRTRQLDRIAETGGRIQQTLDLGELLPAFAVALVDEFDLRHVSVSLVDDEGRDVEAFATGDRTASGDRFELPLRRGWRHVGMLSVRSRRPLDAAERTSLQALGDLLAVALTNARLLQREQDATARLRELDALKNAFLGTVSHELRTSMTAIMGFGELLVDAWDEMSDDRRRELAERVRRSAGSLRHLVDDLLDFARLEQQRLHVSPRPIDLADAVGHTVDSLRSLLTGHELDLRLIPAVAHVDPIAVERIVANLVSNAAKYAPAGTTVTVTVEPVGDRARLVVADQGPGIPEAERARVFVRFYRLDTDATLRTRGAGIGLSILRDFADRSGAIVAIDDAPGGGARFTIDFPTEPPVVEEQDDDLAERSAS